MPHALGLVLLQLAMMIYQAVFTYSKNIYKQHHLLGLIHQQSTYHSLMCFLQSALFLAHFIIGCVIWYLIIVIGSQWGKTCWPYKVKLMNNINFQFNHQKNLPNVSVYIYIYEKWTFQDFSQDVVTHMVMTMNNNQCNKQLLQTYKFQ